MTAIGDKDIIDLAKVKPLIYWFLGLTVVFTAPFQWLMITMGSAYVYIIASMWGPALAAFAACRIVGVDISILGFRWGKSKWILLCYLIPFAYLLVVYGITWISGYGEFFNAKYIGKIGDNLGLHGWSNTQVALFAIPLFALVMIPHQLANSLGEEIGWRGLLAPQLMRLMSFPAASFLSGLIWFIWHIPIIAWASYMIEQRPMTWQIACFAIMLIGMSFPMMYYRLKSGSVWTATIFHASHNTFLIFVFMRLTKDGPNTKYIAGEWGVATAGVVTVIALFYWYKANKEGLIGPLNRN